MEGRKNVVVIGGGAAGVLICRQLSAKLDHRRFGLVLVTTRPYYAHLPSYTRQLVSSQSQDHGAEKDKSAHHIPFDNLFVDGNGEVVIAKVVRVDEDENKKGGKVTLSTGAVIEYTVLVVASGCTWEGLLDIPDTVEEESKWLGDWRDRFASAEDIIIVGGGSSGIEFAGEIRDLSSVSLTTKAVKHQGLTFLYVPKSKRVTIVHDQSMLLNEAYPDNFRKLAAKAIRKRGIEIIVDDAIHDLGISPANTIRTQNGRLLVADLVIPCRGRQRPNTRFLDYLQDSPVNDTGHVHALPTLQLFRHPHIFAAGDIIDVDEQKQISKYASHANVVVHNVMDVLKERQAEALYRGCYERIVIPNGRGSGITYYSSWAPDVQFAFGDGVSFLTKIFSKRSKPGF